ncbi:MAG TPA: Rrf2 family transcriptional regulator [Selenomonas sp.]|nr:Rrf2 family transcriptional regulator [Selenomonadaceae bacterium]HCB93885.1 Rrf2 family transcriptional regulator [Selenomonas sp.]
MKISAKGRYGLAAMTYLAKSYESGSPVTIVSISQKMGISKIYLEQVFALLKRSKLVNSIKGSQGGYQLARPPREITAYDILSVIELTIMEKAAPATPKKMPEIDRAIDSCVYKPMDDKLRELLSAVTLEDILTSIDKEASSLMYYI